jgi:hypothetical protein
MRPSRIQSKSAARGVFQFAGREIAARYFNEQGERVMSKSGTKIDKREDTNPEYGEHKYGDVKFADPVNNKYPIDTEEHVRAAWSYINHKDNAAKYDKDEVETIKKRIKSAAKKFDIDIETE